MPRFSSASGVGTSISTSEVDDGAITDKKISSVIQGEQELEIIELQANASITPLDHDTLVSDVFSDSDGYKNTVNASTDATYDAGNKEYHADYTISYLEDEEFEGTGTPAGWGGGAGIDYDEASVVKVGSESLKITRSGSNITATYPDQSATALRSFSFWGRSSITTGIYGLYEFSADWVGFYSDGTFAINANSTNHGSVNYSADTWYLFKVHFNLTTKKMDCEIYASDGTTLVDSASNVDMTASPSFQHVFICATADGSFYADDYKCWSGNIAAEPTPGTVNDIVIDLPTITGTVAATELICNEDLDTGNNLTYKLYDGTNTDDDLAIDTKNDLVNVVGGALTGQAGGLTIHINRGAGTVSTTPEVKSYSLKLWKV